MRRQGGGGQLRTTWLASVWVALFGCIWAEGAFASPNTHAPAISTWDARASNVVLGYGQAVSGDGGYTRASYNANFVSTNGVLEAQFGVHYVTYQETDEASTARGVSAGGVALVNLPLSQAFENGVPGSAFAFYIGGVPTALFSGQRNFISIPLVLGIGLPYSPTPSLTFTPWVELSPGFNFDTRIQAVSTAAAIESARDGTLSRAEVEDLVEEGLDISQQTNVGKRAGLSFAVHVGERVDFDLNLSLGAGHASALALGAGLVFRWDTLVSELHEDQPRLDRSDCALLRSRCARERDPRRRAAPRPAPATRRPAVTRPRTRQRQAQPTDGRPTSPAAPRRAQPGPLPRKASPAPPPAAPAPKKPAAIDELPPLQAAPPRAP
jgi:hypothetical protein